MLLVLFLLADDTDKSLLSAFLIHTHPIEGLSLVQISFGADEVLDAVD